MSAGDSDESATLAGRQYRYDRFTTSLLFRDLRFRKEAARPGDSPPAFALATTDGDSLGSQDLRGNKPRHSSGVQLDIRSSYASHISSRTA